MACFRLPRRRRKQQQEHCGSCRKDSSWNEAELLNGIRVLAKQQAEGFCALAKEQAETNAILRQYLGPTARDVKHIRSAATNIQQELQVVNTQVAGISAVLSSLHLLVKDVRQNVRELLGISRGTAVLQICHHTLTVGIRVMWMCLFLACATHSVCTLLDSCFYRTESWWIQRVYTFLQLKRQTCSFIDAGRSFIAVASMLLWQLLAAPLLERTLSAALPPTFHQEGVVTIAVQTGVLHGLVGYVLVRLGKGRGLLWLVGFELWVVWVLLGVRVVVQWAERQPAVADGSPAGHGAMLLRTGHAVLVQFVAPAALAALAFSSTRRLVGGCLLLGGLATGGIWMWGAGSRSQSSDRCGIQRIT